MTMLATHLLSKGFVLAPKGVLSLPPEQSLNNNCRGLLVSHKPFHRLLTNVVSGFGTQFPLLKAWTSETITSEWQTDDFLLIGAARKAMTFQEVICNITVGQNFQRNTGWTFVTSSGVTSHGTIVLPWRARCIASNHFAFTQTPFTFGLLHAT